jgi:hypothetical protein
MAALLVAAFAARAEAQTCRATEVMDRDHPFEVGPDVSFGQGVSSVGFDATYGNRSGFIGGGIGHLSTGGTFSGSSGAFFENVTGGVQLQARKKTISICPFVALSHTGSQGNGFGASGGALTFEGGAHVAFGGARSGEFRVVPFVGGGVGRSRLSAPFGVVSQTAWATDGILEFGLGMVREDSTSIQIGYTVAFNSSATTTSFGISLHLSLGHL